MYFINLENVFLLLFQTNFIKSIGGTNAKNFVKRVLLKLFTNELASKCSWTGLKNNFSLENLIIIQTMKSNNDK